MGKTLDEKKTESGRGRRQGQDGAPEAITQGLLEHIGAIVESCGATALFVYVDALDRRRLTLDASLKVKVFCVTKHRPEDVRFECHHCVRVPDVPMTRMGRIKIAIFLALSRGWIKPRDRIVFLSGQSASKTLDTILVTEVDREYEIFSSSVDLPQTASGTLPEVLERVVDVASELGSEGREGRSVGAMFIVGDVDHVIPLTRQLVLNPFKGYPAEERNILDSSLEETVKELATLDGAFIVRGDGVIEACGAYIRAPSDEEYDLPPGLGARHHAAATITATTAALAVTVSESTGSVTIFRAGRIVTEIEKPRSTGQKRRLSYIRHRKPSKGVAHP